ncbi:TetR/AcrR family transcriptional regulator [Demequina aestuarii]|uniref:TetR/AcrR family transcriptional regulator n=1 Tax=Demequina aestuarii TaxID=327095 RepID=UPI0007817397|nr:TetR/AcrR family transcriptional regulator [Demequina aestuarii]
MNTHSATAADGRSPATVASPDRRARPHGKPAVGRDRVLASAARLFVEQGYAATTTRQISAAVGIKQPSLYYHFPNKAAILVELLVATAEPSMLAARDMLADRDRSPLDRLIELIDFDVRLLASGPWNIGSLYLLPETAAPECVRFRELRSELAAAYETLVSAAIAAGEANVESGPRTAALLFSLVEGVILRRNDASDIDAEQIARDIQQAAIRVLGATPGRDRA